MQRKPCAMLFLVLAGLMSLYAPNVWCQTEQASEYQVKAAFLYNFAKFVEWPDETTSAIPSTNLNICVIGKSPFGNSLNPIEGNPVRNRRITITPVSRIADTKNCDMLFVGASEKTRLEQILAVVASRPILTVSDIKHFVAAGGMIGFISSNDRLRFEINNRLARRSNLRVSAQLLKLATTVVE